MVPLSTPLFFGWTISLMKCAKEFNNEICTYIFRRGDGLMVHHGTIPIMVLLRPGATMTALSWFLQVNGMVSLVAMAITLSARFDPFPI
jgi:hypothetical protein